MSGRLAFLVDVSSCSGCKTCQVACQDAHALEPAQRWRRVADVEGGEWRREGNAWVPGIVAYSLSVSCQHCASPACVPACPTGAIETRGDGTVAVRESLCIGCRYCSWACPYGAPQFGGRSGTMSKCDFCADERDAGREPVCVSACPLRAIEWGEWDELRQRDGVVCGLAPLPDPALTQPSLLLLVPPSTPRPAGPARVSNDEEIGR